MRSHPTIAVVGATGAVGREFLSVLEQRRTPMGELRLLASARSAGSTLPFRGGGRTVETLTEQSFRGVGIALFSAGSAVSKQFAPAAVAAGAYVIDNSSAFRMTAGVPLVIPEVNPESLDGLRGRPGIIANPNCSTIIMLMAVTPLRRAFGVERIVVSTYQAVSGAGWAAMEELREQSLAVLNGTAPTPRVFSEPCAFNVFSHNSAMDPATGRNLEEEKMVQETRKIWNDPRVRVSATCVRVPVFRAHAESISVELTRPAAEAEVRRALADAPGVRLVDDRAANRFPTPINAAGGDDTLIGRIRPDESLERVEPAEPGGGPLRWRGFNLFAASDQLRKGAALNAVQIAELLVR